jgi:Trp operon repressor
MTTPQQQYTETIKNAQDAMLAALRTWTRTFQQALGELPATTAANREHLIDQGFNFVTELANAQLNAQRQIAKQLTASGTPATTAANREHLIDQGFDAVGKLVNTQLHAQRQLAKTVQASAEQMTEALRGGSVL